MNELFDVVWTVRVFENDDGTFAAPCAALKPPSFPVFAREDVTSDDWNIFPPLRRDKTDVAMAGV